MKAYFNWSSGKDSALALFQMKSKSPQVIKVLVTTVNSDVGRVSMHGLRESLLDAQAAAIDIPLHKIYLSGTVSMKSYNTAMAEFTQALKAENYTHSIFGDIFLEDLRSYREQQLAETGITAVFPLWERDTKQLIREFLSLGFKAITVCVNAKLLDKSFVGRIIDESFLNDLPDNVDPCGENGEFHTFVFDGPIFSKPVAFEIGEKILRSYLPNDNDDDNCFSGSSNWDTQFWYCDLVDI